MTESEAKGFIQGKIDCMKKCGIFNKEDNVSDNDCDNCEYCYSQGNFGEQKNAFEMAIKALEEVQKYRAIDTVEECRENKDSCITKILFNVLKFIFAVLLFIALLTFIIAWSAIG